MNKKGFTMIELLATLVLFGILSSIAVVSVNKYIAQSRQKAYKLASSAISQAAESCVLKNKCDAPTTTPITTTYLINNGFLKKIENPIKNKSDCTGSVSISEYGRSVDEYKDYYYKVKLICDGYSSATLIWPYSKTSGNVENYINKSTSNEQEFLNSKK